MKNLFKALADFQQEVPVIHKDTQGYGYTYADLPKILEIINPLLKKHGLGFTQPINGLQIKTILFHIASGEILESTTDIPQGVQLAKMNDFQVLGSAITYLRRYAISSILGLVTDKDSDANGQQTVKEAVTPNITKSEDAVQWLNIKSDQFEKLNDGMKAGKKYTLAQIRKQFKVSKETAEKLTEIGIV